MAELTTIELYKENFKFSSGHYTIFSPTRREPLHGHNFTVYAAITAELNEFAMTFDYDIYKKKIYSLCKSLTGYFLLAGNSKHQTIEEDGDNLYVHFNDEKIPFLKKDVIILPLVNITVEDLAKWFIEQLLNPEDIEKFKLHHVIVKVFSAPGQSGSAQWSVS